jgi:hypothetical protein
LAEPVILENCGAAELTRFFSVWPEVRERMVDAVLMHSGLTDANGRFVELEGL